MPDDQFDEIDDVKAVMAIFTRFHDVVSKTLPFSMMSKDDQIEIAARLSDAYETRRMRRAMMEAARS
jgi:hypothetical protein